MSVQDDGGWARDGLTLRDYFAAQAFALVSRSQDSRYIAECAYEIADAMLEARK